MRVRSPAPLATLALAVVTLAVAALACGPAAAHDLWISSTGTGAEARVVVNYGHPGDRPPPLADKVLDIAATTASGSTSLAPRLAPAVVDGTFVLAAPWSGDALLAARYDNGFWVETPDGTWRNSSRLVYQDAKAALWSIKFAKALVGPGAPWRTVLGHELEIVPLADPAALTVGSRLPVRVLFRGKPLAGIAVERGDGVTPMAEKDMPTFRTNEAGIAEIPIARVGPHLLAVDHDVTPPKLPTLADRDLYNATLMLDVPPRRGSRHGRGADTRNRPEGDHS
ncbi:MAG: DUF4198 domain-containing protein [Rhodoplanes sp.]|uniref:DUF4198 domain-containing protein n=1 Tax=Rhodoplanes sp. TaxID=1968906 RepID=UPI00184202DA|nr:DUF4198 domain-containing protein [Rhodoplanes sp.]NVO15259.1 DUF4198 domain-containing protein [Rhodoplanes sp.]